MELRKRLNPIHILMALATVGFVVYLVFGLQFVDAADYRVDGNLTIPSIDLKADVVNLNLEDGKLNTPDTIVGSFTNHVNKTLLIGHSTTVFQKLKNINLSDNVQYNDKEYSVISIELFEKSDINMTRLLASSDIDTLVLMTCAGELLENGDATHRLIVTAVRD